MQGQTKRMVHLCQQKVLGHTAAKAQSPERVTLRAPIKVSLSLDLADGFRCCFANGNERQHQHGDQHNIPAGTSHGRDS